MVEYTSYIINHNFFIVIARELSFKVPEKMQNFSPSWKNVAIIKCICLTILRVEKTKLACFVILDTI